MKITEIDYKVLGKEVEIIDFRNVASRDDMRNEFNHIITNKYCRSGKPNRPYYYLAEPTLVVATTLLGTPILEICKGDTLSTNLFNNIIKDMKAAAKRLIKIRKEYSKNKVKTIKI